MRTLVTVALLVGAVWPCLAQDADRALAARIQASRDIAWLESMVLGTGPARALLVPTRAPNGHRLAAYVRIGALATPAALAAIDRVEARLRTIDLVPARVRFDDVDRSGLSKPISPVATIERAGTTYALFDSWRLRGPDIFIAWTRTPDDLDSWTRPLPTGLQFSDNRPWSDITLRWSGSDSLTLEYRDGPPRDGAILGQFPRSYAVVTFPDLAHLYPPVPIVSRTEVIDLSDVQRDADHDGWTDIEERILGLNPADADSDADGLPDGRDTCPDFPRDALTAKHDGELLSRAFFAVRGFSGTLRALTMRDDSAHFFGYNAPILRRPRAQFEEFGSSVWWEIERKTDHEARVWVGSGRHGQELMQLKRVNGHWVVVAYLASRMIIATP
jgi:hypothetical protein